MRTTWRGSLRSPSSSLDHGPAAITRRSARYVAIAVVTATPQPSARQPLTVSGRRIVAPFRSATSRWAAMPTSGRRNPALASYVATIPSRRLKPGKRLRRVVSSSNSSWLPRVNSGLGVSISLTLVNRCSVAQVLRCALGRIDQHDLADQVHDVLARLRFQLAPQLKCAAGHLVDFRANGRSPDHAVMAVRRTFVVTQWVHVESQHRLPALCELVSCASPHCAQSDDDHIMRGRGHWAESMDVRDSLIVSLRGERTVPRRSHWVNMDSGRNAETM